MKNIKKIAIRWTRQIVVYFVVRNIIELIHPTSNSENKIISIALEAILFGIIMTAFQQFRQYRKNKQSNKTTGKAV